MAVFIFHLGICTLSAFGLDAVLNNGMLRSPWLKRITIASAGVALLLWLFLFAVYAAKVPSEIRPASVAMTALAAVFIICILHAAKPSADGPAIQLKTAAVLLIGVMMLEVGTLAFRDLANKDGEQKFWSSLWRDADVARFLKSRPSQISRRRE